MLTKGTFSQRMLMACALAFVVAAGAFAQLPPEIQADKYLLAAKKEIDAQHYVMAIGYFEKIIDLKVAVPAEFWYHYGKTLASAKYAKRAIAALEQYLREAGQGGAFYTQALELLIDLENELAVTTTTTIAPLVSMVRVPGGSFWMGSESSFYDEKPVHLVTVNSFIMSKYEVTQEQYRIVTGSSPSSFSGTELPVEQVSWYDAVEFCNKLSEREGLQNVYTITARSPARGYWIMSAGVTMDMMRNGYRLPTEAEWEFAACGGKGSGNYTYAGSDNLDTVAWHGGNSGGTPHRVGTKAANALGLYDMTGNVWEWCWDWYGNYLSVAQTDPTGPYSGKYRVSRGGTWHWDAAHCRLTTRESNSPGGLGTSVDGSGFGFRIVRRP